MTTTTTLIPTPAGPIQLAPDEWLVGFKDGNPMVRRMDGRFGMTVGVIYVCDPIPEDDREAFNPMFEGR